MAKKFGKALIFTAVAGAIAAGGVALYIRLHQMILMMIVLTLTMKMKISMMTQKMMILTQTRTR